MTCPRTDIPWATHRWNPVTGCSPAGPECAHCYAAALARRFKRPWGIPIFHPDRLAEPRTMTRPARIFLGSTTDLGHPLLAHEIREAIWQTLEACSPALTFILSTKRPGPWLRRVPSRVWILVSVCEPSNLWRWRELVHYCPEHPVLGISAEPLLAHLAPAILAEIPARRPPSWLIAGPETGAGARPCDPAWLEDLQALAAARGIPFFSKLAPPCRREYPLPVRATPASPSPSPSPSPAPSPLPSPTPAPHA